MFRTVLIANRGEIACRVIRTCRRMGIATVAVYSDADADAPHVALADRAVRLGGAAPADSYLRGDAIVDAMRATGAQAVHPGYGFLSENAEFADAVAAAGLVFVGPSARAMRIMGRKDAAKAAMREAGVPVVPGHEGADQSDAALADAAAAVGYPVLIKAVAGGGGKGMRAVHAPGDFADALGAARAEARGAFGDDRVLIERLIDRPRHVEVQVFGDGTRAVHLFERDCSLQRRHQKVLEEAPAPGMSPALRDAMGAAAVRAAEAIGYGGAGTVEFVADATDGLRADRFFFLEMNTRLQVEHPVTEAVTGIDLVEWQLRVAAGEPLWVEQDDLSLDGHAVEVRLYAEDPANGFLPATGQLTHLSFPPTVRVDAGVAAGDPIGPDYDPMIAKVIAHAPTRAAALAKVDHALSNARVAGTATNLSFLRRLVRDPDVVAGDVDTGLIARKGAALTDRPVPCTRSRSLAALAALGLADGDGGPWQGFALWAPLAWVQPLVWQGEGFEVRVAVLGPGRFRATLGDAVHEIVRDGARWRIDGDSVAADAVRDGDAVHVFWGNVYGFAVADPLAPAEAEAPGADVVTAPMPGLLREVRVAVGDAVAAGDRLAVLEAMKMEHALRAPRDGTVAEVLAAAGTPVAAGAALIRLAG
ncbi:biotin carboxylase N-terminal domain-containing protein [Jannaschia sp. LMIT008]|uniref:ATP-binding protein n=1 Tax=Jannaschia maritima TaxID=3032585 RepID=UPI002810A097|nr:biotin carboxylase N-terminal domain-containing protein [Jannaschia sp. LMIT008]